MFHSRKLNLSINNIHEKVWRLSYKDYDFSFDNIFVKDNLFRIVHHHYHHYRVYKASSQIIVWVLNKPPAWFHFSILLKSLFTSLISDRETALKINEVSVSKKSYIEIPVYQEDEQKTVHNQCSIFEVSQKSREIDDRHLEEICRMKKKIMDCISNAKVKGFQVCFIYSSYW